MQQGEGSRSNILLLGYITRFGIFQRHKQKTHPKFFWDERKEVLTMKIKVIIHDGIVTNVLADESAKEVDVEIVDIDRDYEDYDELQEYEEELYGDKNLQEIGYSVANFGEDYDN